MQSFLSNKKYKLMDILFVTFITANWGAPQTVTVTGVDDLLVDGNQPFFIITDPAVSFDTNYDGLDAANVSVINSDDDMPGITIGEVNSDTTEAGGQATFIIKSGFVLLNKNVIVSSITELDLNRSPIDDFNIVEDYSPFLIIINRTEQIT